LLIGHQILQFLFVRGGLAHTPHELLVLAECLIKSEQAVEFRDGEARALLLGTLGLVDVREDTAEGEVKQVSALICSLVMLDLQVLVLSLALPTSTAAAHPKNGLHVTLQEVVEAPGLPLLPG
jgi:hypothetical protein